MAQFSDTTNKAGLIQQIEKHTGLGDAGISGDTTLLKQFTADINNAYSRCAAIIAKADGRMQWDDANHSNGPTADFNLVSGQKNYSIFASAPSALQDWLEVERVDILDSNDLGVQLHPIDIRTIAGAISEYAKTAGIPFEFDFHGSELNLYPAPNYNKTSGGTIFFKRAPSYFASTDTTKVPGFNVLYHELLALWPSYWWAVDKGLSNANTIRQEIVLLEKELAKAYKNRSKYERPRLARRRESFK